MATASFPDSRPASQRAASFLRRVELFLLGQHIDGRYYIVLVAAVLAGAMLRFWNLAGVPPGLQQDEAVYGYDAYSIFETGRDHLGHPFPFVSLETFGDWSSPLLTFLEVPAVGLFGLHVEVLRGVTALGGTVAIPAMFVLGTLLFRRPAVGTLAAVLLAVSPMAVHLSRWAIIPSLVPTMVTLTLATFAWSMHRGSERGLVLVALLAGLTISSYYGMRLYVPLALIPALIIFRHTWLRLRLEALVYAALVFAAIAGPVLYFSLRDPGGGARFSQTSVFEHGGTLGTVFEQYFSYFSPRFWFTEGSRDAMQLPLGNGIELLSVAPLLLSGLVWLSLQAFRGSDERTRKSAQLLLALIVLYPVPGALTTPAPDSLRAAHVIPFATLTAAIGAVAIVDLAASALSQSRRLRVSHLSAALVAVLAVALAVELSLRYAEYFGPYREEVAVSFHDGIEDAIEYVYAHESEYDEVWIADDVHAGYIYVLVYRPWPPEDVHRRLIVVRDPPNWNEVTKLGEYSFDVATPVPRPWPTLYTSFQVDGSAAYEVLELDAAGKRVLLLRRAAPPER